MINWSSEILSTILMTKIKMSLFSIWFFVTKSHLGSLRPLATPEANGALMKTAMAKGRRIRSNEDFVILDVNVEVCLGSVSKIMRSGWLVFVCRLAFDAVGVTVTITGYCHGACREAYFRDQIRLNRQEKSIFSGFFRNSAVAEYFRQ